MKTLRRQLIAKKHHGHHTSSPNLKLPESKTILWVGGAAVVLLVALAYYFLMPVAEVVTVRRGTAISAVYGTVRIEPAFVVRIRAQNEGFIQLAEPFAAGRGAIGKNVEKGQLLAKIADEEAARQLKQARADLQAAVDRAALPLPSSELLKAAEVNVQRLEEVGEVKPGMKAKVQLYAYRTRSFTARVTSVQPAADPTTQRYTIVLEMENPPDNLMAGMTGEMNIITGTHDNALLVPTRALLVDQALIVKRGIVHSRTVGVGFRTLDFTEVTNGLDEGSHVIVSDQDKFHSGETVRQRIVSSPPPPKAP